MYAVILAGGGGTRLWPLSDPERPKPFIPLLPNGRSLLEQTVARLTDGPELGLSAIDLTVVTDGRYECLVRAQAPTVAVVAEPFGRNTAGAIALAALAIDRDMDDVMVVLPADHLIGQEAAYRAILAAARDELALGAFGIESPIVTLGAHADRPATEYGYLVPDPARSKQGRLPASVLAAFEEKPDVGRAAQLLGQPGVAWNAGMFMARRRAFLAALERYTDLVERLRGRTDSPTALAAAYEHITPISIDYAVMQAAARDGQVVMGAMDVGWSDVGSWSALLDAVVGGHSGPARVVVAGESVTLGRHDLVVRRDDEGVLVLEGGPRKMSSPRPMAFLPGARQYEAVLGALLDRVNDWSATPIAAGTPR
jgi:mannose-1-phosphate guanylyltransferase